MLHPGLRGAARHDIDITGGGFATPTVESSRGKARVRAAPSQLALRKISIEDCRSVVGLQCRVRARHARHSEPRSLPLLPCP
jgi:hypothetical protein